MPLNEKTDAKLLRPSTNSCVSEGQLNEDFSSTNLDDEILPKIEHSQVFEITQEGPNFRGVGMYGAAILIAKSQLGLGVLGLPSTLNALGFLPGLLSLACLCFLSTYTGLIIGKFRNKHPHIYCIDDAAYMLFGRIAREIMGWGFWLFYTLCYGSALLTISIAFNSITEHPICTVIWIVIGAIVSFVLGASIRTMRVLSFMGYFAMSSILLAVWIVAIACLTQKVPAAAPVNEPINKMVKVAATGARFNTVASAIAIQFFSLCGTASFFSIQAEMRDPKQYGKSLLMGQALVMFNYIVLAIMIYSKVGQYVASPALGSAGELFKKIAYGIALPGLFWSSFFTAHLAAKYALIRILRGTTHLQSNTNIHWITWLGMITIVSAVGFLIAGAIPFFKNLVALTGALVGTSFTLFIPACLTLHELGHHKHHERDSTLTWIKHSWEEFHNHKSTVVLSMFCICVAIFICVGGLYGAISSTIEAYSNGTIDRAFSCANNA
ncbi:hypothetical protein CORT_0E03030 [Candida orthopsilosis Co 90-125]|uniref:Amino acid transporter transmembrane domain-containing protein n=1 Tax=Candida orthopsilosis (strain 90-125) TaxID=1136231 RepID=H8X7V6_CANO9|nr:hypothetical protein CORT_0E03030 [Candida orthopsilosis Co 90-125]CCG23892.1 hypothetical protein CORT_0E03030 [Candida orthopsilosis Co 90-125]